MKSMEQVHPIKELQLQEKGPYQIAKELNMDPKTVRKYMDMEGFSPPKPATRVRESNLDPFKPTINQWLLEDELNRPKQRHTVKRVYNRSRKECPNFEGSYVIDNATAAGRRMGDVVRLTQLFKRFQSHFGFELTFIPAKRNLVCFGPVGTGKTHLAIATGIRACEQGLTVKFYTVAKLVMRLAEAKRSGTLERLMNEIQRTQLLILYEWGYVPVDKEGSQLLFRVIADSYESHSMMITTNIEFSKWGSVFMDDQMAAAMIDRLAHHGHSILFEGESYRKKHALMRQRCFFPRQQHGEFCSLFLGDFA